LPSSFRGPTPALQPCPCWGHTSTGSSFGSARRGTPRLPIRLRIRETPRLDALLRRRRVRRLGILSRAQLLEFAPRDSQEDILLAATVRSLACYLDAHGLLARPAPTPREQMVAAYRGYLERVRGLAESTLAHHCFTASELLGFLGFDGDLAVLRRVDQRQIEAFVRASGTRLSRASLQHVRGALAVLPALPR
jgi:hypothetical protein